MPGRFRRRVELNKSLIARYQKAIEQWKKAEDGEKITLGIDGKTLDKDGIKEYLDAKPPLSSLAGKDVTIAGMPVAVDFSETRHLNKLTGNWDPVIEFTYKLAGQTHRVPYDDKTGETSVRSLLTSFAQRARNMEYNLVGVERGLREAQETIPKLTAELEVLHARA